MNERIPISVGFFIEFSPDGRALSRGREERDALLSVLYWLQTHPNHEERLIVEHWVQQKEKQIEEDDREQQVRSKRQEINALVDRAARESNLRDPAIVALARTATFDARGIPQSES